MTQELISAIFEQAPFGYAFHRLVLNERSKPEDYVFLDVNPAFEQMTRLKRKDIIGKGVTEVIPGIRSGNMDWVALYGQMVATGRKEQFTQYAEPWVGGTRLPPLPPTRSISSLFSRRYPGRRAYPVAENRNRK